jgi:predicted MFS family arabinose efflux permease
VVIVSTVLFCLALPPLATIANPVLLAAALLVFGGALGSIDVAMNIQAVIVERMGGRSLMSGFHGLYSLGGIAGAACMTAVLGAGASPFVATLCVVAGIAVALALAAAHLLPYGSQGDGPSFALPHGVVLFIGVLCFVAFLAEGSVLDWSAVFLTSVRGMGAAYAGLGYAMFSLAMTVCRLMGDRIVQRFGGRTVIVLGGLCAAAGFAVATLAPFWQLTLAGYGLIGVGCSNIVPVLYSSAGRQTVVPEHVAISAITTLGYAGILAGPAAIGLVAQASSLSAALLILAVLQVGVAASGWLLRL